MKAKNWLPINYKVRLILALLAFLLFSGCSNEDNHASLEAYASELPGAIKIGPNILRYLSTTRGKPPDVRMAIHYKNLIKKWQYVPDPPNYDHFINVESAFKIDRFRGDCEDFSATVMAICGGLNLTCHIALGINNNSGHAWPELKIHNSTPAQGILKRLKTLFGSSVSYIYRSNGVWLQLSPDGSLSNYRTQYLINSRGQLQQVEIKTKLYRDRDGHH